MKGQRVDEARVGEELAALGEDPLGTDDFDVLMGSASEDVDLVGALARFAEPLDQDAELSELGKARVWNAVRAHAPTGERGSTTPTTKWSGPVAVLLAAAVAVLFFVPWGPDGGAVGPGSSESGTLGQQARLTLQALGVDSHPGADAARARALAEALRLRAKEIRG